MAVRQRGNGWQADACYKGARAREQFDTEKAAVAWELQAVEAMKKGKPVPTVNDTGAKNSTLQSLVDTVTKLQWKTPGTSASVIHAQRFADYVGPKLSPAEALTQINVDEFIAETIAEREISGATVNRHLSAISVLSKKAYAYGLIDRKLEMPWQDENEARLRFFSEEDTALIEQTLLAWSLPRWRDFFIVLVDTGGRTWTEVGRMQWRDFNESTRTITFWDTKNGDSRSIPLTTRAYDAIVRQRPYGEDGPFKGCRKDEGRRVYGRIRSHLPDLRDTVWYTARHTFASWLVQRGVDLYTVQKLMGHRSSTMTQRYAKLAPKHLRNAMAVMDVEPQAHIRLAVDNAKAVNNG